jgi:SAM-dependent methyltransferase
MEQLDLSRALTFGRLAADYARFRPSYPREAVDWLVPDGATRVADVGAGTGQLTARLLERGLAVEAVEPDAAMLAELRRSCPAATTHEAGADALPLPDASVDAVLVATAWHWFPFEEAVAEVRRVLRPGGWLGLVWNLVTPREPWERELTGLDPDRKGSDDEPVPTVPFLEPTETARFPWAWEVTPEHFRGYLATNSAVMRLPDSEREQRLRAAEDRVARACAETGRPTAALHHAALCFRWRPS